MRGKTLVAMVVLVAGFLIAQNITANLFQEALTNADHDKPYDALPSDLGLVSQNVTILSGNLELAGWWIPTNSTESQPVVVLVHGFNSTMSRTLQAWASALHNESYNLLLFDLRGHGQSQDIPENVASLGAGEADDVLAAVSYVRDNAKQLGVEGDRIALYGESMGGAAALHAARTNPAGVSAVLSDSAFSSPVDQAHAENGMPKFVLSFAMWSMGNRIDADILAVDGVKAIGEINAPVFLAHCTDDERVPFSAFEEMHAVGVEGAWSGSCPIQAPDITNRHVQGYLQDGYWDAVISFLQAHL